MPCGLRVPTHWGRGPPLGGGDDWVAVFRIANADTQCRRISNPPEWG